jgi:hypothetical protein
LREEEIELRSFHEGFLSSARAARTLRNYRLRITAAFEAARRDHKHVVKKSAGLTVGMIWLISRRHAFAQPGRARELQWEFAFGSAVSVAFKILLRYGDLARCLWDHGYCDEFHTHVCFYVEGRKNAAHGCAFWGIARPAGDNPDGIYFVNVFAKDYFRTGYVLPRIGHCTGAVDHTRTMSICNFVVFLRAALVNIGLTKEEAALFAGQSARAGGATEAAAKGLHQEDFNTWRASPPRNGSPGTTADTSRSGFASRAPSASEPLKRKVGVGKN